MTRIKKTRKVNNNGPARPPRAKSSERKVTGKKVGKGQTRGSRHSVSKHAQARQQATEQKDTRLGSKTPIALFVDATTPTISQPIAQALTPDLELAKLEADPRLNLLLERTEAGETLKAADQQWLDATLDRIAVLMEQLGLDFDDELDDKFDDPVLQSQDPDDLFSRFEQGEDLLNDYKH